MGTEKSRKLLDKRAALLIADKAAVGNDDFVSVCTSELNSTILDNAQDNSSVWNRSRNPLMQSNQRASMPSNPSGSTIKANSRGGRE